MKRIFLSSFLLTVCLFAAAQAGGFSKAVAGFKGKKQATATVTKIRHNTALAKDVSTQGTLVMSRPSHVCISMEGGKEMLLMEGGTFTMVEGGRKRVTSASKNPMFATFQRVFEAILAGGQTDASQLAGVTMTQADGQLVLTIGSEGGRRTLFTSFVLAIDTRTSALKWLRMNERRGNYTEYQFTRFAL